MQDMEQRAQRVASLEENFQLLVDNGLLKYDGQGNVSNVSNWEEHQQLKEMK